MPRPHDTVVNNQFGSRAQAYVTSAVHAGGEDLDALEAAAAREKPERAIDLGAGGGHVAYRLAPHARSVTAVDLSQAMADAVRDTARERDLSNIEIRVASAERLPSTMHPSTSSAAGSPRITGVISRAACVRPGVS